MKMYDSYKDSGVEWIEQIPSDWAVLKNKYFTKAAKEPSQTGEEDLLSVSEYSGIVPRKTIRIGEDHLTRSDSLVGYLLVKKGQLVSNIMLMWKRGLGVSDFNGIVSPAYSVFDFTQGNPRYFHYLYRTDMYISEFRRNSTGVIESRLRLYDDSFGAIYSHFPPIETQDEIVHFLNAKTSLIESLIEKTQRKIELLREKRTSLINAVVTKGLNPKSEMKDSGVDWIGDIPNHWQTIKFKFGTDLMTCGHAATPEYVEDYEGEIFLSAQNIKNEKVDFKKHNYISSDLHKLLTKHHKVEYGDILQVRVGGKSNIGQTAVYESEKEISIYVSLSHIKLNHRFSAHFIKYLCNSSRYKEEASVLMKQGGGVANFNVSDQEKIKIPYPPISEQQQIVEFLDEQTQGIDKSVSNEEEKIKLLKEYRQSLISSVVTGKIKVTEDAE